MQIRGTWSAGPGDDQARFLADLRALRDSAAIGYNELAARAHYPSDILRAAENGPRLPGLPVLTAYVRACAGNVLDWEERWRRLALEGSDDPGLPVRPAGASPAAVAGARAGVGVAPPDVYDPERIKAALRGDHARSDRADLRADGQGTSVPVQGSVAGTEPEASDQGMASLYASSGAYTGAGLDAGSGLDGGARLDGGAGSDAGTSSGAGADWGARPSWDAVADPTVTAANGNHSAKHAGRGPFDAAVTEMRDHAERTETGQADEFSWLPDSKPVSRPAESESAWPGSATSRQADSRRGESRPGDSWQADSRQADSWRGGSRQASSAAESGLAWQETTDNGRAQASAGIEAASLGPPAAERAPRYQDSGLKPPERTDFWAPAAPTDVQLPAAPSPRAEEPAIAQASWPAPAGPAAQPRAASGPAGPSGAAGAHKETAQPSDHRQDRFFSARLLVVIVIAALIGSALVMLLK